MKEMTHSEWAIRPINGAFMIATNTPTSGLVAGANVRTPFQEEEPLCELCGEAAVLEVLEYYPEDCTFTLDTCCEAMNDWAVVELPRLSRKQLATWFELSTGIKTRQIITEEAPSWCVDPGLSFSPVDWKDAKAFVAEHHRNNAPPPGWRFGQGLRSSGELVAVVIAGRPVAPKIDHRKVIEVTRLCVKDLFPRRLGWNACSMLYGYVFQEARRRGYEKVISYTHPGESGASLRAAGFVEEGLTSGGSWHRASRPRPNAPKPSKKRRWAKYLLKTSVPMPAQLKLFPISRDEREDYSPRQLAA
jgi:hypothetical protein